MASLESEIERLQAAVAALESQRSTLGDAAVDAGLAVLRRQLTSLQADQGTSLAGEQRRLVTIFFTDIIGFTRFSEERDPEEVAQLVAHFYEIVAETVDEYGGEVARYIGDAVMAVFGLERTAEDDAEQAVLAGMALPNRLLEEGLPFEVRCGVHTGLVLMGMLEAGGRHDWTVLGDAVNVASRLQQAAPPNGLLISRTTFQQIRGLFDITSRPPLEVRGKSEPLQTYLVAGVKPQPFYPLTRGIEGLLVPTVGREEELSQLQAAFLEAVEKNTLRCVAVIGDPGIGKSRLLLDMEEWLELRPEEIRYFRGHARPSFQRQGQHPYALLRTVWFHRFALAENTAVQEAERAFEAGLRSLWPDAPKDAAPVLGHLVGLPFTDHSSLRGLREDAAALRGRSIVLGKSFWQHLLREGPVALLFEDLHWADAASTEWLEQVLAGLKGPFLLIGTARPEEQIPSWPELAIIPLGPLSEDESRYLVQQLLQQVQQIPSELESMIAERAEGVPYYAEEIVNWLLDQKVLEIGPEHWTVHMERLGDRPLPATLQYLLLSRVDALSEKERSVLQWASVVGRVFWQSAIHSLGDEPEARHLLRRLQDQRMVERRTSSSLAGEEEWMFRHVLLRDVTYETLLRRDRPSLHRKVAQWLEARAGERLGEYAGILGAHYELAGEKSRAASYYQQAMAQSQFTDMETAIDYGQRALAQGRQESQEVQFQLYGRLGQLLCRRAARYDEAMQIYRAMEMEAQQHAHHDALAQAHSGISWVLEKQGDPQKALERVSRFSSAQQRAHLSQATQSAIMHQIAWLNFLLGNHRTAREIAQEALEVAQKRQDQRGQVSCLNVLAALDHRQGAYKQAQVHLEEALQLLREMSHWRLEGTVLNNLGEIARSQQEYDRAEQSYREALLIAQRIGDCEGEFIALSNLGASLLGLGETNAAESFLRRSIELQECTGSQSILAETHRFLAKALLEQDRVDQALEAAQNALSLSRTSGYPDYVASAWRTLARVAAHQACTATELQPEECFAQSLRVCEENCLQVERAHTLRALGHYLIDTELDPKRGHGMLSEAEALLQPTEP
jgi:class 3 adenylate cyclase/predicted ATPase